MPITTCVFDAYGTLFDVNAAARRAANDPEHADLANVWPSLAEIWRTKQLQYTWLRSLTGDYVDFWQVTQDGLDFALEKLNLGTGPRERILQLYWELEAYPEVQEMLTTLKTAGLKTAILSNGSNDMLNAAVTHAGLEGHLDHVLSVETVGTFKPSAVVYEMVETTMHCDRTDVLFVSSNGWDIAGASGFGFTTAWVNRTGEPQDRLAAGPHHILNDLTPIPTLLGM